MTASITLSAFINQGLVWIMTDGLTPGLPTYEILCTCRNRPLKVYRVLPIMYIQLSQVASGMKILDDKKREESPWSYLARRWGALERHKQSQCSLQSTIRYLRTNWVEIKSERSKITILEINQCSEMLSRGKLTKMNSIFPNDHWVFQTKFFWKTGSESISHCI